MDIVSALIGFKSGEKAARDGVLIGITAQPEDATAAVGAKAYFTVTALGENLSYQWQYSTDNGETWADTSLTGNKTATLTVNATATRNGYQYRCAVTSDGGSIISGVATLTVTE